MLSFDVQRGFSHKGYLSDRFTYAAGVSYTYALPIAKRLNLDFSLGVGYMWGRYKKHTPIDNHDVWISTHKMRWFGPTQAAVSLVWLLGADNRNIMKGGEL